MQTAPSPKAVLSRLKSLPFWAWFLLVAVCIHGVLTAWLIDYVYEGQVHFKPSLAPIFSASPVVQAHLVAALTAFAMGLAIFRLSKGSAWHKRLGWVFVVAMMLTAGSSLFITGLMGNSYSPIHALSGWTLISLPAAIYAVRRKKIQDHRRAMTALFFTGLITSGLFSFLPSRTLWNVFFSS